MREYGSSKIAMLLAAAMLLTGCFEDWTDSEDRDRGNGSSSHNLAPIIAGVPAGIVPVGENYQFQPVASDPDGQAISYGIRRQPRWSLFDKSTGRLHGRPTGEDVGRYDGIIISASDGVATSELESFSIVVRHSAPAGENRPPVLSGTPVASVAAGTAYVFQPVASDPDGTALTLAIAGKPAWASFDAATGRLSGTPAPGDVGRYADIVISATDGAQFAFLGPFTIEVTTGGGPGPGGNQPPVISGLPPGVAKVGTEYSFTPVASDPEGATLSFMINNLPRWARFSYAAGTLSGVPTAADVGTYADVIIRAHDGTTAAALPSFTITVSIDGNNPPRISGTPAAAIAPGKLYSFAPAASDPDGDPLTFSIANAPAWSTFDAATGRLSGTPPAAALGDYPNIRISVSDGKDNAALPAFSIRVADAPNTRPTISGRPATSVDAGTAYAFTPGAADADGDILRFGIANKPVWASFDVTTGRLSGTPAVALVGRYPNIVLSVSDGTDSATLAAFEINVVTPANTAPTIGGYPQTSVDHGRIYSFQPTASDANGDVIRFGIANKPAWAVFNEVTGRLSGTPAEADIGSYANIVLSVSDGSASATLPAFTITVRRALPGDPAGQFAFADIPEISFVRGYAETEQLGIWQLDPGNRWEPGDLDNRSGWTSRIATQLEILEGNLSGVSYESATGLLRYNGSGAAGWARVRVLAPSKTTASTEFYVRVLTPDAIWGQNATTRADIAQRFPGVPTFDHGTTSYADAWASIPRNGSASDPDLLLVLGGSYDAAVEARLSGQVEDDGAPKDKVYWSAASGNSERPWFYLIGEPGNRPRLSAMNIRSGGVISIPGFRVSVMRNIEFEAIVTSTSESGWLVGVPNRKYWSKLYAHHTHAMHRPQFPDKTFINDDVFGSDSAEGETLGAAARQGVPKAPNDWRSWFWGNRFHRTGGSNLKHTIYLHGRPDGWLIYNNNSHNGGNQSSAIKATVGRYRVLNSRISAFADESNPGDPTDKLNQQLIDVPSSSDSIIYNNHLIGGRRITGSDVDGTRTGLIWFNPRRSIWGTDTPRYPDVSFQAAPFQAFNVSLAFGDVQGGSSPTAWSEIRRDGGIWVRLRSAPQFVPNASGGGSRWNLLVQPDEMPASGVYNLRMNSGTVTTQYPPTLTTYRNVRYFAVTSFADGGLPTPWYADGPKAYVIDDGFGYWDAIRNWGSGRGDPLNPYTLKKYVAFNTFTWLQHPALDDKREETIRDNGSYPSIALYTGSSGSYMGAVPPNWLDPGVTFLANNRYEGWQATDIGTDDWRRSDTGSVLGNTTNKLYGPGQDDPLKANWPHYFEALTPDKQPQFVEVGGERTPAAPGTEEIALPAWFKLF